MSDVKGKRLAPLMIAVCLCLTTAAWADGDEILGPVPVPSGTGFVGDGIGLLLTGDGTIDFTLPAGAEIKQAFLYWNGFHTTMGNGDPNILVGNSSTAFGPVNTPGAVIGGPRFFFTGQGIDNWSTTYRADITEEALAGLINPGPNMIEVSLCDNLPCVDIGTTFDVPNGASILVVIDEPGQLAKDLQLVDGQDLAFCESGIPGACGRFDPPLDNTEVQTFNFVPSGVDRTMEISLIGASVAGSASASGDDRPNILKIWVDADPNVNPPTITYVNPFASFSQDEWDHVCSSGCSDLPSVPTVPIPANASSVSIVVLSETDGTPALPASFVWIGVATSLERNCAIDVDKQVSCDGGITWYDMGSGDEIEGCTGWDGDPEIKVRYLADTVADGDLFDCVLQDSNGLILPAPIPIGMLPGNGAGIPLFETDPIECSADLESAEPNTAILVCSCFEEGSDDTVTGMDQANIECQAVELLIEKSCDEQNPDTLDNAIEIWVTNPDDPRGASLANCVVTDPTAGFVSDPFDLAPGESMHFDTVANGLTENTLNTASVTCDIVGAGDKTITREAEDICEYRRCDLTIDKEVSCDNGMSWGESCTGWDGDPEVQVRYVANTNVVEGDSVGALFNCTLTDSNGLILPLPQDIGMLPGDLDNGVIWETDPIECSADLEAGEPDTATLTCECFNDGSGFTRTDDDQANIECQAVELQIEKTCDASEEPGGPHPVTIVVTNPANPRGASLTDCVVEDPAAGFTSDPFSLAPGEFREFDTTAAADTEVNVATVDCEIVGANGKRIDAMDDDPCEDCAVTIEKEVSCDGGVSYGEDCIGWDGDNEVVVRYTVDAPGDNDGDLTGCLITDSNGLVIGGLAVPVPDLAPGGQFVYETDPLTCSDALDDGEPDTATVSCECQFEDASSVEVTDDDTADFECQVPEVIIEKDCGPEDAGENPIQITVTNPANDRGADLANCVVEDPLAGFTSDPFDLAPGQSMDFDTSAVVDPGATLNTATVVCDIVGTVDKTVFDSADDPCEICGDGEVNRPEETCDPPGEPVPPLGNDCREDCTYCGDGMKQDDEECDPTDPNDPNVGNCNDQCMIPCGNGIVEPEFDETCDPPGSPAGNLGNDCREDCTYCGDGMKQDDEECDPTDPNDPNVGNCNDQCMIPCGNGIVEPEFDETCDPPGLPAGNLGNLCREDCTFCGDGMKQDDEICDPTDPMDPNAERCDDQCMLIMDRCGDEVVQPPETCDPPGSPAGDLGNLCRADCMFCGDGMKQDEEECDPTDPNDPNQDNCNDQCMIPCGNGIVEPEFGETCDPPGSPVGDLGNTCRDECTFCGDGKKDDGEECDPTDPNDPNADNCNDQCMIPCGNGVVEPEFDETCDPPGSIVGPLENECREDCTYCGDGMKDDDEECDPTDPNDPNVDNCNDQCMIPCGNEIVEPEFGETCDPPGSIVGPLDNECREDCTYCGDGMKDDDEECDPTDPMDPNVDDCNDQCMIEVPCELDVMKTCFVPGEGDDDDDDDDDDDCRGKVLAMKLQYTGDGCDVLSNPQGGKATCFGGADGAEPVSIRVTKDGREDTVYGSEGVVLLGDIVEASAANAGEDKFSSQTDVTIDYGLEEVSFHTSCSQPLQVGDQFGSVRLVELTTTNGGVITLPDEDPDPAEGQQECVISPVPPEPHCDGKVKVLTMKYLGGSCDDSDQDQGDKFSCSGDAGMTQPVRIVCEDYLDTGDPATINLGDLVDIAAANAGDTTLGSQTDCAVYDEFGNWVQDVSFHTSCSKPLNLGDRFGSLEVFSLDTTGSGFIGMGQNVIYTYKITNNSDDPAVNVTVIDDQLGPVPGSPIAFIPAHGMVVLQTNALISEDTTNIVTVDGELEDGGECDAVDDFSIVRVEEPPEGEVECTSKVKATLLTYIGPDIAGPVTVEAEGRSGGSPAVYEFPGGLVSGTTVSSPAENDFTIDATVRGETDLGSKMTISINGVDEVHHTSCSTPYIAGLPAPLDQPKGDPSPNWFVETFTQKN